MLWGRGNLSHKKHRATGSPYKKLYRGRVNGRILLVQHIIALRMAKKRKQINKMYGSVTELMRQR